MRMSVVALATVATLASVEAEADILVTIQDDATLGTEFAYSGTLNVTGLGAPFVAGVVAGIAPDDATINFGSGVPGYEFYTLASGPGNFGAGGGNSNVIDFIGDVFSLNVSSGPLVGVPTGFSSGVLSGSMRIPSSSIATLGMALGTFEWTTGDGQTITMAIGDEAIAEARDGVVPLPGTLPLLLVGIAGLGFVVRQKRTG